MTTPKPRYIELYIIQLNSGNVRASTDDDRMDFDHPKIIDKLLSQFKGSQAGIGIGGCHGKIKEDDWKEWLRLAGV